MLPPPTPADEPRRLQALRSLCLLDTPAHERFDRIVRAASHLFRVPIALVSLIDENRQWFKARQGLDATETPRDVSFCGHAILSPTTFVVPDALKDPRFHDNPLVLGAPFVRFYAGHPLRAPDGSRVGTLCLIDHQPRDLSDADRAALADLAGWAEVELSALHEREARIGLEQQERFFQVSMDMLCIAAMDGTFLRLSQAWSRTLGFSEAELYSTSLVDLALEEDRAATSGHLARAREGASVLQFEHRARCRDGSWRWLQWNAVPDLEEGLLYAVARDVTQARLLEDERQRVERMKNEFISTVSHELRTPLTSIRGSLGLLCGGIAGPLDAEVARMVGIAHKNSERLLRLINDILDLEKMESGRMDLNLAPTDVAPLLSQVLQAHQGYADEYGVRLEVVVDLPDARAHARVDEDRFIQVLANLLSNAIKFSPQGERVTLSLTREAGALRVGVQDHGPGIPEAFQGRVFQKFAQADASDTRKRPGTGLGLSIAHGLVARMGGTLRFTTAPGAGTRFSFDLPECEPGSGAA
ncbi:GAF domain-containing sensor histidine kinase [Corallococcus aberystwythensis]|uniref:histidine kinase n=1 Tax=Corallococcus aberystwythensis TaxID=2316722 RepID=A0A3A8PZJ1_9BACT|nr:ATP-binding protein [Corallococcus aberystwythensis]RKH60210.1 PAS domain S-box protein [Corallococcus aberystwythensis]